MRYMPLLYDSTTSPSTSIFCSFSEITHLLPQMSARGRETHPRAKFGLTDDADVAGLRAFRALFDLVLDLRAFGEALEALAGDRAEVNEDVVAAVGLRDEAVALRVVEPLHGSGCHVFHLPAPSRTCSGGVIALPVLALVDLWRGNRSNIRIIGALLRPSEAQS